MPEIWAFGLIFVVIFSLFWGSIEIALKWLILQNTLAWKNTWRSLFSSISMQLLQIPGTVLALFISSQVLQGPVTLNDGTESLLYFILGFIFLRLITDVTIGGIFLTAVKKDFEGAWRTSLIASSLGAFFLGAVFVALASL